MHLNSSSEPMDPTHLGDSRQFERVILSDILTRPELCQRCFTCEANKGYALSLPFKLFPRPLQSLLLLFSEICNVSEGHCASSPCGPVIHMILYFLELFIAPSAPFREERHGQRGSRKCIKGSAASRKLTIS